MCTEFDWQYHWRSEFKFDLLLDKRSSLLPVDDYIGCYWEWSPRDMEFLGFDDEDNLTNADCITKCAELGYEFAGTQVCVCYEITL